ncbi:MAG: hypothetical protein ACRDQ0_02320 [Pseudonocardia sp.]
MTRVGRLLLAALLSVLLLPVVEGSAAAQDYQPVDVVHSERVQVGPYAMTVGFSTWPLRAMQSLDFTFLPDGGIAGRSGTVSLVGPRGTETEPLARHPRKRDVWGLDVTALDDEGTWTLRWTIDGAEGSGTGELTGVTVLGQPGPPLPLSWAISILPLLGLAALLTVAVRRGAPPR